jgi:hypothetical protein
MSLTPEEQAERERRRTCTKTPGTVAEMLAMDAVELNGQMHVGSDDWPDLQSAIDALRAEQPREIDLLEGDDHAS